MDIALTQSGIWVPKRPAIIRVKSLKDSFRGLVHEFGAAAAALIASSGGFAVPSTSYANTGGTGSRSGVITATSTITFGAGTVANLIDGTTTGSGPAYLNTGQTSGYFKFDFGVGATKYISEVKIYQNAAASGNNGSFNFRGSNDDSTYTTLGTFTNTYTSGGDQNASYVISAYSSYYRYFRLELNGVTATVNTPYVNEIEFKISA